MAFKIIGKLPEKGPACVAMPGPGIEEQPLPLDRGRSVLPACDVCLYCGGSGIVSIYTLNGEIEATTYCPGCVYVEIPEGYQKISPEGKRPGLAAI